MYVSTTAVLRENGEGRAVDEDIHIEDERHVMANGYNASKWVSELMVRRAGRAGMPTQIMRLGRVAADSRGGQGRLDDVAALFIRACLRVGAYPDHSLVEKIVPVDYLSAAIVALAADYTHAGVYHLIGTKGQDWCRLLRDYADCEAVGMRKVPAQDWVQMVKNASVSQSLPFATYLVDARAVDADAQKGERMGIRSDRTVRVLENLGVKEPKVSGRAWLNYLKRVFASEQLSFQRRRRWLNRQAPATAMMIEPAHDCQ
jgi:thioester reductase-like protein